jgi:hypothetical protein
MIQEELEPAEKRKPCTTKADNRQGKNTTAYCHEDLSSKVIGLEET